MKIILSPRQFGKTTRILIKANNYNGYIVCHNHDEIKRISRQAKKMKLKINFPMTFDEFIKKQYYGKGVKKFHIDNAEILLQMLTEVPIETITLTG